MGVEVMEAWGWAGEVTEAVGLEREKARAVWGWEGAARAAAWGWEGAARAAAWGWGREAVARAAWAGGGCRAWRTGQGEQGREYHE